MKNVKRIIAAMLLVVMAFTCTACHKKGEIAVTAKDFEFTSAYYMCALVNAYSTAQNEVYNTLTEEEKSATEIDYFSKKIDDKSFETWVKDEALSYIKEIAAYKLLCKENDVTIPEDELAELKEYAAYIWESGDYYSGIYFPLSLTFEPNGIAYETFESYWVDQYYSSEYFDHIYGEGGEKEIAIDDVKTELYGNYLIADMIEATFTDEMTDEDKTALKEQLDGYVKALNSGEKTFKEVYNEYNEIEEEEETEATDETADESTESTETEETEEVSEPIDAYASIIGAEDTDYAHDYYEDIKAMEIGVAQVISLADDAGYLLVIKQDITADEYYLTNMDSTIRHSLKDDEFNSTIEEYMKTFELNVSKYAIGQYKVKKIEEPDYSSYGY